MKIDIMEEKLIEVLGAELLLDNILLALSIDQKEDILSYIARMFDIDVEE